MAKYEEQILGNEKALSRFWDKVEISNDKNGCHLWTGRCDKNGYGLFWFPVPDRLRDGKKKAWTSYRACRLIWILENDRPIPPGMQALHFCDNPRCVRPDHIRIGTAKDNAADRMARGRNDQTPKGEQHPRSKLTDKKVRQICHLYFHKGWSLVRIANKFKIKGPSVNKIVKGQQWKHITKTHIPKGFLHKYQYTKARNEKLYDQFNKGFSYRELAKEFKLGIEYVRDIVKEMRLKNGLSPLPLGFRSEGRRKK